MFKKIIVLFLLVGTSVFILPSQSQAEVVNESTNIKNNAAPGTALLLPQNRRRRWRNGRWVIIRTNRWNNRRNNRWNNRWSNRRATPRNNNNRYNNRNNNRRNNRRN